MDIEEKILSGVFFSTSPSNSPVRTPEQSRSPSPDPLFPSNEDQSGSDLDDEEPTASHPNVPVDNPNQRYVRGGRTGVKGVIKDAKEVEKLDRERRAKEIKELNRRMEKAALTARTYAEEEEERLRERALEEGLTDMEFQRNGLFGRSGGRFGHLREVAADTFPEAVDQESSDTWVVVHIYDPSLDRSHDLDTLLARLARQYPETKFLRARAGALRFASAAIRRTGWHDPTSITISKKGGAFSDDEEDAYTYGDEEDEVDDDDDEVVTDTDMLPTLLVYRSGQLIHNWIRVDWEARDWLKRKEGSASGSPVEALLRGHNILRTESNGNCGFSSDDEDLDLQIVPGDQIEDEDSDEIFDL